MKVIRTAQMERRMIEILDSRALMKAKQTGNPFGYTLPNGVVVIWHNGHQSNFATEQQAIAVFKDPQHPLTVITPESEGVR